ncbi:methyltransferase domain-containing protein [Candidatus Curtissbacteria bacterium]|nr:methyltransferase domain-containing protein [Candidatus Curtissbacteria bacterium]
MKSSKILEEKLKNYLDLINKNFSIDKLLQEKEDLTQVRRYYLVNHFAYLLFHSRKGFMHMGLYRDGVSKKESLLEHLKIIDKYINQVRARNVLELGAGNGANCVYLAMLHPDINFKGLDLSKKPLNPYRRIKNYIHEIGDYHQLDRYQDKSFDLVFAIETICHSPNKEKLFGEIYKKLKNDGLMVIFDGYFTKNLSDLSKEEILAKKLTEKALAVDNFETLREFEAALKKANFQIIKKEDLTQYVLPTMLGFEKLALSFFKVPILTRILKTILPFDLIKNSIAGLLISTLVEKRVAGYYLHVLKKT